jgi:membrane associated rhomboid family serine protease
MFFPFPIRTEKETMKLPYATMGLIFVNMVIWLFTNRVVTQERNELGEIQTQMYAIERDYADQVTNGDQRYFYEHTPAEFHEQFYQKVVRKSRYGRFDEWITLYEAYKARISNTFFHRWGFIPDHFSFPKLLCSIFIHASFFHVFGNMLFLWCVGCNLEDDWGWSWFLICYILSGLTASGLHALKASDGSVPCVGASGAIAGIMGIFLVKYYKIKIKFFYIFLLRFWKPWGYFTTYAGIVIPIWFAQQMIGASSSINDGVGYWAHIGGFLFGAIAAGTIKLIGLDDGPIRTGVLQNAKTLQLRIDPKTPLVQQAKRALQADPRNPQKYLFYARAFGARGNEKNAAVLYNMGLDLILKSRDSNLLTAAFRELSTNEYIDKLTEKNCYYLACGLEQAGNHQEAVSLFFLYANRFPEGKAREKSLYQAYIVLRDSIGNSIQAHKALAYLTREYPETLLTQQQAPQTQKWAELHSSSSVQPQPANDHFVTI